MREWAEGRGQKSQKTEVGSQKKKICDNLRDLREKKHCIMITQPITILAFGKKIFSAENASLLVMAAPGSISLNALLDALVANTPIKALVLPLLVAAISLSLYVVVFLLDFVSGVKASRHEALDKANYFSSAKGWSSIWKIATVSILVTWSCFFSMLAAIGNLPYLPGFFMLSSATIAIMATLLDIYSIGENQKRLTGKKARIFEWLENVRKLIIDVVVRKFDKF